LRIRKGRQGRAGKPALELLEMTMSKEAGPELPAAHAAPFSPAQVSPAQVSAAQVSPAPAAQAGAKPSGGFMAVVSKVVYWIAGVVFIIIGVARIYGFFFPSLPDCDGSTARSTLSDIFKRDNLEPTAYNDVKTLTKSKDELTCSASLAMQDGTTMAILYRIFWKEKEVFVEVTQKNFNADHK
jgi:hypothetical protein